MITFWSVLWLLSFVLHYGISFAYWQKEFPFLAKEQYYSDMRFSIVMGIFGPLSLIGQAVFLSSKYGRSLYKHGVKFL